MRYIIYNIFLYTIGLMLIGCTHSKSLSEGSNNIELMFLQPEHFHAALVQKYMHDDLDPVVQLYADQEATVEGYLSLIQQYNSRSENPTDWKISSYFGDDFLDKAFRNKKGNVVVLAGDNNQKIDFITKAINHSKDVFADKPLVINEDGYHKLAVLMDKENASSPLIYDIMTERYDVKNRIVKELLNNINFSGGLKENINKPAIQFNSTHHFIKEVSGKPLIRPAMFYNTLQQGEGLVDVTTHYIDLVFWMLSSERKIDLANDLKLDSSFRWSTPVSHAQFVKSTNLKDYPNFIDHSLLNDGSLAVFSNGKLDFTFRGVPVSIAVKWNTESVDKSGDRFLASYLAHNFRVEIKPNETGSTSIYVIPEKPNEQFEIELAEAIHAIDDLPGLSIVQNGNAYQIVIPQELYLSHEEHFSKVLEKFVSYKREGSLPDWEKSFIMAKYYLTTQALKHAKTISNEDS